MWAAGRSRALCAGKAEDGKLYWEKRQVPQAGKLGGQTADREQLSPDQLLEALRGPLGA
jgi:hypothetical protein